MSFAHPQVPIGGIAPPPTPPSPGRANPSAAAAPLAPRPRVATTPNDPEYNVSGPPAKRPRHEVPTNSSDIDRLFGSHEAFVTLCADRRKHLRILKELWPHDQQAAIKHVLECNNYNLTVDFIDFIVLEGATILVQKRTLALFLVSHPQLHRAPSARDPSTVPRAAASVSPAATSTLAAPRHTATPNAHSNGSVSSGDGGGVRRSAAPIAPPAGPRPTAAPGPPSGPVRGLLGWCHSCQEMDRKVPGVWRDTKGTRWVYCGHHRASHRASSSSLR